MIETSARDKGIGYGSLNKPANLGYIPVEVEENDNGFQRTDEMAVSELYLNEFNKIKIYNIK